MTSSSRMDSSGYNNPIYESDMEHRGSNRVSPEPGSRVNLDLPLHDWLAEPGPDELELLRLAKQNDLPGVQQLIKTKPNTNVNALDDSDRSGLLHAVGNHNHEMVRYLFTMPNLRTRDALLYAVQGGRVTTVQLLLELNNKWQYEDSFTEPVDSVLFPAHMTPLMLAAILNQYDVIRLLLVRGHHIEIPNWDAGNSWGSTGLHGDSLQLSLARIDTYRALSSPAYLCASCDDPFLNAFLLSHEAQKRSNADPVFKADYEAIAQQCRQFVTALLDQCRTSDEVWLLLKKHHPDEQSNGSPRNAFPRLKMALEYNQKEFISHRSCQQVLQSIWTQHHPEITWLSFTQQLLYFTPRVIILPLIYVAYFFFPCATWFKYWEAPIMKFLGDVLSYVVFLVFIMLTVVTGSDERGRRVPGIYPGYDVVIWVYVASYLLDSIKLFYIEGLKAFTGNKWNAYMLTMELCFLVSFAARIASFIRCRHEFGWEYEDESRVFWPWMDPALVSEAFYCLAAVFAFGRILFVFDVSMKLGPLQLCLSRMISEILQMLMIFAVVITAFATGMTRLYVYYTDMVRVAKDGQVMEQSDSFMTWENSLRTLFFDIFGNSDVRKATVVVDNRCANDSTEACFPANDHRLTEGVGYVMYGAYHVLVIIILINMLIAMMSHSFRKFQKDADQAWKFSRAQIWLTYFERRCLLPNPFNLIPSIHTIMSLLAWCNVNLRDSPDQQALCTSQHGCFIDTPEANKSLENQEKIYKVVVSQLVRRYLKQKAKCTNN